MSCDLQIVALHLIEMLILSFKIMLVKALLVEAADLAAYISFVVSWC